MRCQNVVHFPQDLLREVLSTQDPLVWGHFDLTTHHFQQSVPAGSVDLHEHMDMMTSHFVVSGFFAAHLNARSAVSLRAFGPSSYIQALFRKITRYMGNNRFLLDFSSCLLLYGFEHQFDDN